MICENYFVIPGISIDIKYVRKVVSNEFNILPDDLNIKTHKRSICLPRQVCISIAYVCMGISGNNCAKEFNLINHATIIYAVRVVRNIYDTDKTFRTKINLILHSLSIKPESWRYGRTSQK